MANKPMVIGQPLVIMFEADGGIVCHIHPSKTASSHEHDGLLICDLVRHVARAFKGRRGRGVDMSRQGAAQPDHRRAAGVVRVK
ncbi:MAG TPA: hypothetical protein VLX44_11995 [Xanthobacteraceae bacterium]|nr:hypothetical protein [Xanthobacteraceae bacterium]